MDVNYPRVWCGWHLPYLKKEGARPHSAVHKHSFQYNRRSDWRFGVLVGMWNINSLSGKGGEMCEKLSKRMIDMCCFQEVIWRGQVSMMLEMEGRRYKLWWCGRGDEIGGVGLKEVCGGSVYGGGGGSKYGVSWQLCWFLKRMC